MKNTNNPQGIAIAVIVLVGIFLGALIVQLEKPSPPESAEAETSTEQTVENHPETKAEPENKTIVLMSQQIEQAGISTQKVKAAKITNVGVLPGEIRFNDDKTAHIVPRLAGVVESIPVHLGQQVKKGQLLAVISSPYLSELRSELLTAQQRLELASTTLAREKQLWEAKISAQQDYLQAQQALQETRIAVQNAKQKLTALGTHATSTQLNRFEIQAPFDGMIVEKHIVLGEAVKEDSNVFTLSDLSSVWADINVSAKDLSMVQVGKKVVIRASALDSEASGVIAYVGSLLGEQTRTAKARVMLDNPQMVWRAGLFITVEIPIQEIDAPVAVLNQAIQTIDNQPTVFIRKDDGFVATPIKIGHSDSHFTQVLDGVDIDDEYVIEGSFILKAEHGKSSVEEE